MQNTHYEHLKPHIDALRTLDVSNIERAETLGELKFTQPAQVAESVVRLANAVKDEGLKLLPAEASERLARAGSEFFNTIEAIRGFRSDNPSEIRRTHIANCNSRYNDFVKAVEPALLLSLLLATDRGAVERRVAAVIEQAVARLDIQLQEGERTIKERNDKFDSLVENLRRVSGEQGVGQLAEFFMKEATEHKAEARWWLRGVWLFGSLLLVYTVLTFFLHRLLGVSKEPHLYEVVQLAVSKVLGFGVLSYALYLCTKNYLANKHNEVVNRHRQNSLRTFVPLVDAAKGENARDIVLTQAATSIFGAQSTGFSGDVQHDGASSRSVVELIGGSLGGKSS